MEPLGAPAAGTDAFASHASSPRTLGHKLSVPPRLAEPRKPQFGKTFACMLQGKNRPTRRAARKKDNIIEEKKANAKQRLAEEQKQRHIEQQQKAEAAEAPPEGVPRALHTFCRKA